MAKGLSAAKAKKMLEDGRVRGTALTEKQKKLFGAVAGGATPLKAINGGWLDKFAMGGSLPGASGMMYSRNSGSSAMSPPNLTKAQDGDKVMYGTPEYEAAYEEGRFAHVPNPLDEVVINSGVDYEKYPLYDKLSVQEKEYFNDPGTIGRGVRRAAQTDRGLSEDTVDMVTGMLVKQPLAALQVPQSLMVEGIETLRGKDANFLNALTFDTQRLPSQTMGFETTSDMSWYNPKVISNFAMDVVSDPLNLVGAGIVDDALKLGLRQGLTNTVARSLDRPIINTLGNKYLPNANKINPWAYQYNLPKNTMWRGLGQEGMEDAVSSGLFRSKQNVPDQFFPGSSLKLSKSFGTNPYFTPKFKTAATYGDNYLAEVPRDVANWTQRYKRSNWSQFADRPIPTLEGRVLQKDWLRGYKPIEIPQAPSSFVEAAVNPSVRQSLKDLNDELGIVNTASAQIRASEKFNKNWFNHPDIIKRTEQMINQPSKVRANMSEVEILQDINMYNTMLDKTPNLPANLQAKIKDNLKDLNAGLAKRNLETVQQKGRFTEVFDENNLKHQEMGLHYDENPRTLGLYKGSTNQASVNLERIKEKAKDVGSVITHEDLHAITVGKSGYTDEAIDILDSAVGKDQEWWLNKINTTKDQKKREELIDRLEYLARPQEIHARVHELRKAFNLKPGQEVSPSKIEAIMTKGLKGETPVDEGFFRLLGDKENFRKIFNKLPAYIPAAVGLGAASQNKNGGSTPKAQVGDNVAAIASQMEANEEDGGRPPLGVVDHIRALFDEEGLCRDNTCVQTVKDFYTKAGIEAMPKDVYNNREFLKNFKEYGFEEILDQKNLQPGDVLQYYYGPDSEDVKEDPSNLNFPYHMGVYVNPGEYIGDGDSKAPIQRKNMYTGTKDGKEYKKDPFRAFRYTKQNKNGGWLSKYENGGVIEDDRGQWAHPGKITKINSNKITMKGVNYPVLGISDTGDKKMMQPGKDYKFDGNSVTEYPMAKNGKSLVELDQLTNFTNYNTSQPGGWLNKYN